MILHYIEKHGYHPPQAFQEAVLACPPTDSEAYFELLAPSLFIAECEKICPNLRSYHAEASQRHQERARIATDEQIAARVSPRLA